MERRLIVMRHAKSDWESEAPGDHERPLSKRGRRDAPRVGKRLAKLGWKPELVLSSDATRATETWQRMSDAFEETEVRYLPSFYMAGPEAVRQAAADVPATVSTLLVLGHNPGWEGLLESLAGKQKRLTTANAALLHVEAESWPEALSKAGDWRLKKVIRPKDL